MIIELVRISSGFNNIRDGIIFRADYTSALASRSGSASDRFFSVDIPNAEFVRDDFGSRIFINRIAYEPTGITSRGLATFEPISSRSNAPILRFEAHEIQ